jgi:hypothetical protein
VRYFVWEKSVLATNSGFADSYSDFLAYWVLPNQLVDERAIESRVNLRCVHKIVFSVAKNLSSIDEACQFCLSFFKPKAGRRIKRRSTRTATAMLWI